jgi:putative SOS response-associated peptidase YedK
MQWGFTSPELRHSSGGPQFNSRWEILERHAREASAERRCLVAADGFYHFLPEGRTKRPFRFEAPDGGALLLAGVWEPGAARDGGPAVSVLTRAAQGEVARFHKRSPVIVPKDLARSYLDSGRTYSELRKTLTDHEPALSVFPVTPKVNRTTYSGDDCGQPFEAPEQNQTELPFGSPRDE